MNNRSPFTAANRQAQNDAQRMLNNHANWYQQYRANQRNQFDVQEVKIDYTSGWWRNKPNESMIVQTIASYERSGWQFAERKEDFCFTTWQQQTVLKFQQRR